MASGETEEWDGTNWSISSASLSTATSNLAGAGSTRSAALEFGGNNPTTATAVTQEYNSTIFPQPRVLGRAGGIYLQEQLKWDQLELKQRD